MRLARGWRQTGQAAGTVLQLGVPEPGERRRRAQVSETDRVPDREASLVRSFIWRSRAQFEHLHRDAPPPLEMEFCMVSDATHTSFNYDPVLYAEHPQKFHTAVPVL